MLKEAFNMFKIIYYNDDKSSSFLTKLSLFEFLNLLHFKDKKLNLIFKFFCLLMKIFIDDEENITYMTLTGANSAG